MDYTPLILIALLPAVVAVQIYLQVRKLSEPEKLMFPLDDGLTQSEQQIILAHREWLNSVNLQYLTGFRFGTIRVAVFQQTGTQRFFSFYFHQKLSFSIETYFDDLTCVDTGTSGSTGLFPRRPGNYKQSFPGVRADVAWQFHLDAEDYLARKFGFQTRPLSQPYTQVLLNVMRLHMQYVRSLRFWPVRGVFWYAFSRGRMSNKTAQELYP